MKKNSNVVKYKKPFQFNIGVVIFVIIFIYLVFNVFSYLTENHISVYEVEQGKIAVNNIYNGLILRSEKIYTADYSGEVNYYVKETSRIGYQNLIYSVDENGNVSEKINEASLDASTIDKESLNEIEEQITNFQSTYSADNFYNVYSFKADVNEALNETLSMNALNSISDYISTAEGNHTFHKIHSDTSGIVAYYTDGFESVTTDNFSAEMFNAAEYKKVSLKANKKIVSGAPAYKLIDSELWNIILPISAKTAQELADDTVIRIRFVKDSKEMYADYVIQEKDSQYYMILSLKSSMVRYAMERYIEIELLLNEATGLKIPNSAITEKEFYTIPVEMFLKGGDSSDDGLLVKRPDEKGNITTEFISPTVYFETDEFYYIDSEKISSGDILAKPDSSKEYVVGSQTASLKGVYNINKGYAVFKQIDILYQNEEYSIVQTGTEYGVALYDHIALDSTKIKENELIK